LPGTPAQRLRIAGRSTIRRRFLGCAWPDFGWRVLGILSVVGGGFCSGRLAPGGAKLATFRQQSPWCLVLHPASDGSEIGLAARRQGAAGQGGIRCIGCGYRARFGGGSAPGFGWGLIVGFGPETSRSWQSGPRDTRPPHDLYNPGLHKPGLPGKPGRKPGVSRPLAQVLPGPDRRWLTWLTLSLIIYRKVGV
jgi:hypothetical protein